VLTGRIPAHGPDTRNIPGEALALAGYTLRRTNARTEPATSYLVGTVVVDGAEPGNRPGNASPRSPRALWWGRPWRGRAWHVDETCGATVVPVRCECGRGASRMHPSTNFQ